jgi:hypothetical protein
MSEIIVRYVLGTIFAFFAIGLVSVGSAFSIIPAVVSVYMLGSLLFEIWRGKIDV